MSGKGWADDSGSSDDDDSVIEDNQQDNSQSQEQTESSSSQATGGGGGGEREKYDRRGGGGGRGGGRGEVDNYQIPPSDFVIFVGNLSYSATDQDLVAFFTDGGCKVSETHIFQEDGRSRGNGVVIFQDKDSYLRGLEAQGQELLGRKLNVKSKDQRKSNNGRNDRGPDRGYNSRPNTGRGDVRNRDDGRSDGRSYRDGPRDSRTRDGPPRDGPRDGPRDARDSKDYSRNRDDRRGGRGEGRGDGRGDRGGRGPPRDQVEKKEEAAPTSPAVRPTLNLKPRTLPVEKVGEVIGSSALFGDGKPRDELAYEEKKKKEPSATDSTAPVVEDAPVAAPAPVAVSAPLPEPPVTHQKQRDNRGPSDRKYEKKERDGAGAGRGGDRGGRGRGEKGRGEGGRGRGRGENRPKEAPASAPTESVAAPAPPAEVKGKSEEAVALAKFQNAQEKINKNAQKMRSQESKKGEKRVVNTFGALQSDSEEEDS